jgi:primosomal protein N' (replication factor Y)
MTLFADVVFPLPLDRAFTYRVPDDLAGRARPGARAAAPFGPRTMRGFIVGLRTEAPAGAPELKDLRDIPDAEPIFSAPLLDFTRRLSRRHRASWGEMLEAAVPPILAARPRQRAGLTKAGRLALAGGRLGPMEKAVAEILAAGDFTALHLARRTKARDVSGLLARMRKKGFVEIREDAPPQRRSRPAEAATTGRQLELGPAAGPRGAEAADRIERALDARTFESFYLFGGREERDEVCARIFRAAAAVGRALWLQPEVDAAESAAKRLAGWVGAGTAVLHCRLSPRRREEEWAAVRNGRAAVAVGTRQALFAPLDPLRLVVVDDEADEAYVQEESPAYDARGGARLRAEGAGAVFVAGSARPSVEAFHEAVAGGRLADLGVPKRRGRVLVVDDRTERSIVGRALLDRLGSAVGRGEPGLVLVGRRGYAAFQLCSRCGAALRCPTCHGPLASVRAGAGVACRSCGHDAFAPSACPECGSRMFVKRGAGVEAVADELRRRLAGVPVAVYDPDGLPDAEAGDRQLEKFRRGAVPVLVGTRLLAGREDVASVRMLGVLSPEAALGRPDYRSAQRAYQALGRMLDVLADDPEAEAVVQTSAPGHHSIRAAVEDDYRLFFDREIELRRAMTDPPFSFLAEVAFEGRQARPLAGKSRAFADRARAAEPGVEVLGPSLASSRPGGFHRIQIVLRSPDRASLDAALDAGLAGARPPRLSVFVSA